MLGNTPHKDILRLCILLHFGFITIVICANESEINTQILLFPVSLHFGIRFIFQVCQLILQSVRLFSFLPCGDALSLSPPHLQCGLSHVPLQAFGLIAGSLLVHFGPPTCFESLASGPTSCWHPRLFPNASGLESTPLQISGVSLLGHNYT